MSSITFLLIFIFLLIILLTYIVNKKYEKSRIKYLKLEPEMVKITVKELNTLEIYTVPLKMGFSIGGVLEMDNVQLKVEKIKITYENPVIHLDIFVIRII